MQHVLQTGLSAGLSAVSGIHGKELQGVDPSFDNHKHILPLDFVPNRESRLTLRGKTHNVHVPYISWGAWSWGDASTWHYKEEERPRITEGWELAKKAGQIWIDTAQVYGSGRSEEICKELFAGLHRNGYVVQTKWDVVPSSVHTFAADAPANYLKDSLKRLGVDCVDIYLVHGPIHPRGLGTVAKSLAKCVDEGWTKVVGVANYGIEEMLELADELAKYGVPLATNQVEFNVLRRYAETHGLLDTCKQRGIVLQSYSSLAQGRLTGKYTADHEPPKTYRFSSYPMKDLQPTIDVLQSIAEQRGVSTSAVALNYNLSKGVVPVVGFRSAGQVEQNLQCLGWRLSLEEMDRIDAVSLDGKTTKLWQHD